MAENSWPFYGAETNETQFSKWARTLADNGIATGLALTPGGAMQVTLGIGNGLVRGLFYENTSALTKAVTAAPAAGQVRLDYLLLKLDQTANTITFVVKAGTANTSGGALPSLVQDETTFEFPIGILTVASGTAAITAGMINELRPGVGARVQVNPTTKRPAANVALGVIFLDTTTKQISFSDGTTWTDLVSAAVFSGILPVTKGGTGVATLKLLREALDIHVQPAAPAHKAGRVWIPGTALV